MKALHPPARHCTFVAEAETCGADKLWVVLKPIPIERDEDEDAVSRVTGVGFYCIIRGETGSSDCGVSLQRSVCCVPFFLNLGKPVSG